MASICRFINKAKWYKNDNVAWLAEGDLQADALKDIETKGNALSVWRVENLEQDLERLITLHAATKQHPHAVDYVVLDFDLLVTNGFKLTKTIGNIPDPDVANWHHDIIELSAKRLLELASIIQVHEKIRVSEKNITRYLLRAIEVGTLSASQIDPQLLQRLQLR